MKIAVILPSYNEMPNISQGVLEDVWGYLSHQSYDFELLLSDDGSTDGTAHKLDEFAKSHKDVRVLHLPHRGKGPTVLDALEQSKGELALFTDFDQATPISELEKLLPYVQQGFEVVIGSRELAGSKRQKEPIHRHIMGKAFNFLVQLIAIRGIHDTQCGFKLFSRKAIQELAPRVFVYRKGGKEGGAYTGAFDVELLFLARKFGYKIAEVPIAWKHVKTDRVNPVRDSLRMLRDISRIRLADLQGRYEK
ncbi:MAG TPA: dolichyl-phosphate beta-glucosyltransferase [Patescibacteria group bacterium]|nr:dolichyl-phosphate beta-glucosyltransferase [Patescibacteria group bacterium]